MTSLMGQSHGSVLQNAAFKCFISFWWCWPIGAKDARLLHAGKEWRATRAALNQCNNVQASSRDEAGKAETVKGFWRLECMQISGGEELHSVHIFNMTIGDVEAVAEEEVSIKQDGEI